MAVKYRLDDEEKEKIDGILKSAEEKLGSVAEREAARQQVVERANKRFEENLKNEPLPIAKNGYVENNKSLWDDIKGIGSNFVRSIGNLGINAVQNTKRRVGEDSKNRMNLIQETNNKYLTKSLQQKGYDENEAQEIAKNAPSIQSIANNSRALNNIAQATNRVVEPIDNKLQEWKETNKQRIEENIENASNPVSKKILELTPSIAQSSVNFLPGGNVLFASGITQDYYEKGLNERGLNEQEASKYASIMATLESATELVGAQLTKGVGKAVAKGNIKSALLNFGLDVGENFLEEAVMEPLEELTVTNTAGAEKADWDNMGQRMLQAGIDGALTSILMGGASAGVGKAVAVVEKMNNGQTVTQTEIKEAVKEVQDSGMVNTEEIIRNEIQNSKNSLQQNRVQNENIPQTQQVIQQENKMAQNPISNENDIMPVANEQNRYENKLNEQLSKELNKNGNFEHQLELYKSGQMKSSDILYLGQTPEIYKKIGLRNNPITLLQGKLKDIITQGGKTSHQHGISIDTLKQLPLALENPLNILQSKDGNGNDCIVVITDLADTNERPIIASIQINADGQIGNIHFDTNRLTSAYGKRDYDRYMQTQIKEGNMLYDIDEGIIKELPTSTGVQFPKGLNSLDETSSFINNIVPSSNENVNNSYSMQNEQNNATKTMWKKPTTLTNNQQILSSTPKATDSSISSTSDNIPQNTENMQVQDTTSGFNYAIKNEQNNAIKENINNIIDIEEPKNNNLPSSKKVETQNKIAQVLIEPIKNQKPQQRTWAILKANLIDKGAVFESLSLKTKNRELQAKYDATLSSGAKGQYAIGNDRYFLENGKKTLQSKSLTSIIDEVGKNSEDFYNYMYHQLNIDRMTLEERFAGDTGTNYERKEQVKNKPVFSKEIDAEYSRQEVVKYEEKYPEFKEYAKDVYDFLDTNKAELVKSGVISQELADKFKEMYPHYVPIQRVGKNNNAIQVPLDTNRTGINNPIKKAKGGNSDIQPLFNTMADRTLQTYRASARNAFGVELKNTLEQNNMLNAMNEETDIDTIMDTMADEEHTGLTEGNKYKNPTFTVFDNGQKVTYDINKDMYDALKPQNELLKQLNDTKIAKIGNKISNARRAVLTEYNPLFSITNSIKDAQDVLQNSQHATKTYAKFPEAYAQIVKKGYWYTEYTQNGGEQNSYFKDGNFEQKDSLPKGLNTTKKVITFPFEKISQINGVIEMAPRLAEYIASRESGRSIETSMLDAARVTTNFKAGGDITKFANRNGATFLNAGVQGMSQQIRNIKEAHAKGLKGYAVLATKTVIAGLPALILNNLIWKDDDDYEELQDYVKDNYYIVGKIGENQFIRIPKGRVSATIQKLFTTTDKYMTTKKEINANNLAEDFWTNVMFTIDNVAPNNPSENNIFSPIKNVIENKTWYGDDLVPTRLQKVPEAEQYDETTDAFSKWLGQIFNWSPMKINYLLDQYGGGVSDVLLPIGTPQAENNAIEDKFTTNSIMKNKNPGEFYDKLDKITVSNNSLKATDEDKLKYKYMSSISSEMSDLYKQKREEQNSSDDDETKKKKVEEIQNQINQMAKKGLQNVDSLKITGNTATIGNAQYYKSTSNEESTWNKVTDKEKEKNKNISLNTYADYKNKVAGKTKDTEKIQILINSNYSSKEKMAIYENYIKDANDEKYNIVKTTGIDINKYLEYKSKGLTTKDARYDYIVNMSGTTYMQKIILFGLENAPSEQDKKTIVNYINTLPGKTQSEKQEMLKSFSWYK